MIKIALFIALSFSLIAHADYDPLGARGTTSAVDGELTLFSGAGGKQLKRASGTGIVKSTSGVASFLSGGATQVLYGDYTFADPQVSAGSNGDSSYFNATQLRFPNSSVVTNGTAVVIDTDPDNILSNGSFEAGTPGDGWTDAGTETATYSNNYITDGLYSASFSPSSESIEFSTISTLYASALGGNNLVAFADVYSTSGDVYLCPVVNGSPVITTDGTMITSCDKHPGDSQTHPMQIAFVGGGTNNGVKLVTLTASTGAVNSITGTVHADKFRVKKTTINTSAAVGPWTSYSPAISGFGAGTTTLRNGFYRIVGDSLEIQIDITKDATPGSGAASVGFGLPTGYTYNSSKVIDGGSGNFSTLGTYRARMGGSGNNITESVFVGATNELFLRETGAGTNITGVDLTANTQISLHAYIPVNELNGNVNTYTAQCGANCENILSAQSSSAGVVSAENVEWITGNFTVTGLGRFTATLPSTVASGAMTCTCSPMAQNGDNKCSVSHGGTSLTVDTETNGADAAVAFNVICQKNGSDYKNTRTIVGSFKDHVTSKGTGNLNVQYGRVRCAGAGTASILQDTGGWMASISAVSGGACTVTLNSGVFSSTPTCFGGISDAALGVSDGSILGVAGISSTSFTSDCEMDDATACTDYYYGVVCWETY
jgi:hypothetical protein